MTHPAPASTVNRQISPITVEMIGSTMESIVDEMGEALVRASFSTNIKERRDCSTALLDIDGKILCQAEHIPMHLGSFLHFVVWIRAHYPLDTIRPGDIYFGNDAYEGGGSHLPDIVLCEPIFHGGTLVAWAINCAHHSDFVDRGEANIYQEGIRIPPLKLYREGVLQTDIQDFFLLNCQVPAERISDLQAQMAANRLGVVRFAGLCDKYGADTVERSCRALLDYAERKTRAAIAKIPDGEYSFEDSYDFSLHDESIPLGVTIRVEGDEMYLDFSSPPQVRGNINVVITALLATVYYAMRTILDPEILPNAGIERALHVNAPKGTILNCEHPAAVMGRIGPCQRVVDLIYGALAHVAPSQVTAAGNGSCYSVAFFGQRADKSYWVYPETIGGGSGARYEKDGLDGVHVHLTNTSNLPVEALEAEYPITVLRYELVSGSGGCGRQRGGLGIRRVYRVEEKCQVITFGSRLQSKPWGLMGGEDGASGQILFRQVPGSTLSETGFAEIGDEVEIVTAGAGGYGCPSERSPEQIEIDMRDEVFTQRQIDAFYADHALAGTPEAPHGDGSRHGRNRPMYELAKETPQSPTRSL